MPSGGYSVVNYHGVLPADYRSHEPFLDGNLVRQEVFREQLRFLKSHYHIIAPDDFRESLEKQEPLPHRSILVTCDDGLLNTLTEMLPVLQEEQVPCLFFVTAESCRKEPGMLWYEELYRIMRHGPLGEEALGMLPEKPSSSRSLENFQAQWWEIVRQSSRLNTEKRSVWMNRVRGGSSSARPTDEDQKRWRLLNLDELRQLTTAGMTIGAHTLTHPILSQCSDDEVLREIQVCKMEIEKALGTKVWAFAYPYGNPATMGDREFDLAEQAGYSCAFLNVEHWHGHESSAFAIPRIHVTSDMTLPEFSAHVSGFHLRLHRAVGA
jgi:peptidoglycan/xylan/chitin deacetylase (PgdA/CDA1 family)